MLSRFSVALLLLSTDRRAMIAGRSRECHGRRGLMTVVFTKRHPVFIASTISVIVSDLPKMCWWKAITFLCRNTHANLIIFCVEFNCVT